MANGLLATFYSFKGGVGRTFVLANVAVALSKWGYRVLCIDWDLEAPGLGYYFAVTPTASGLVELASDLGAQRPCNWRHAVTEVKGAANSFALDLIPAGRLDQTYTDRMQALNWLDLYERQGLAQVLEEWRSEWLDAYDVVLIDSRTGVTDAGAICTAHLPDVLAVVFTANAQSLDGALNIAARAATARDRLGIDRPALLVLPVPSRFDASEEYERALEWRKLFVERTRNLYAPWVSQRLEPHEILDRCIVPYVPYWSFGEGLPLADDDSRGHNPIRQPLEVIAALLGHRLSKSELLAESPDRFIEAAARAGRTRSGFAYQALVMGTSDLAERASTLAAALRARGLLVVEPSTSRESATPADLTREIEQAQNGIFLFGSRKTPEFDAAFKSFAAQALEDDSNRLLVPLVLATEVTKLPTILRSSAIIIDATDSDDQLTNTALAALGPSSAPPGQPVDNENAVAVALEQIGSGDALASQGALATLKRLPTRALTASILRSLPVAGGDHRLFNALTALGSSREERLRAVLLDQRVVAVLLDALRKEELSTRVSAIRLLGQERATPPVVKTLISFLSDPYRDVRLAAATALARTRSVVAIDYLLPRIQDQDDRVSAVALTATLNRGGMDEARQAVTLVAEWSQNSRHARLQRLRLGVAAQERLIALVGDPQLGMFAAGILLAAVTPAIQAVSNAALDVSRDETHRSRLIDIIGASPGADGEVLLKLLDDEQAHIRAQAAKWLTRWPGPRTTSALIDRATFDSPEPRIAALTSLATLESLPEHLLFSAVHDARGAVRIAAIELIGKTKNTALAEHLLERLKFGGLEEERVAAASALSAFGDPSVLPDLLQVLDNSDSEPLKAAALEAVVELSAKGQVETLIQLAGSTRRSHWEAALPALEDLLTNDSIDAPMLAALEQLKTHSAPGIRTLALLAAAVRMFGADGRIMLSVEADGRRPFFGDAQVMTREHVEKVAFALKSKPAAVRAAAEQLASHLNGRLRLGWERESSAGGDKNEKPVK